MNTAEETAGAIGVGRDSTAFVTNCRISQNNAARGGGIWCSESTVNLTNTLIDRNEAFFPGAGLQSMDHAIVSIRNCTIVDNLSDGSSSDVYLQDTVAAIANSITPFVFGHDLGDSSVDFRYSIIQNGASGEGVIDHDPLFVDPSNDNYRLAEGSPAIDAGDNNAYFSDIDTDLDGNPRFLDDIETPDTGLGNAPIIDMGAYEFQFNSSCPGDCNRDGAIDFNDLTAIIFEFGNNTDICDADGSGTVDFNDLTATLFLFGPCP